ncbi:cyclic nucleotide-binding domain-containing protein [Corallincola luteus]|uniref:histidine kinase n=1 Tax=Corallincola luteus TaxID=1775177 RepID=A0ABY2AN58_9GAMM|nr:ATP-binding protein [Corallincola luteus]TCI04640.1 cyclic nucleotide-binding domain-containing protein [Corallincola luteus]
MTSDIHAKMERLKRAYFDDDDRRLRLAEGEMLVDQGERNERLYLLLEGRVIGYREHEQDGQKDLIEVFRSGPGAFVGMHSFFSGDYISSTRIVVENDAELAYIDRGVTAVEPEKYGSFVEQFMPLMVSELAARTLRATRRAAEKEEAQANLYRAEKMSTLGQLAAGLAHEMNNAIGVISRKTEYMSNFLDELLQTHLPVEARFYRKGRQSGEHGVSAEMRKRVRDYQRAFDISRLAAKQLARIAPTIDDAKSLGPGVLSQLDNMARYWELGRDIHDMEFAAYHAANIVKSVKVLGRGDFERGPETDIEESIVEAIALVKSDLRAVNVELDLQPLPTVFGNITELVQVWVNLLKNAVDAMVIAKTNNPTVTVKSKVFKYHLEVSVTDNGPGVPEELKEKIFQPDFTTKKSGLSFGLGLGLAIVQRLVESYQGEVVLRSRPGKTTFKVKLPIGGTHGNY